jgi:hypothetical protein
VSSARRGFFPAGGGALTARALPLAAGQTLLPLTLTDQGAVVSVVGKVTVHIASGGRSVVASGGGGGGVEGGGAEAAEAAEAADKAIALTLAGEIGKLAWQLLRRRFPKPSGELTHCTAD